MAGAITQNDCLEAILFDDNKATESAAGDQTASAMVAKAMGGSSIHSSYRN